MSITPASLIKEINVLSDESYELHQELAEIQERKGDVMFELIQKYDTKAKAEIYWEHTADGKREAYLKSYLKGLTAKRGARVLEYKANAGLI